MTTAPRRVLVVGGGAAGMMAAIAAARAGAAVTLCERQSGLGCKLAATGGGRCNLANTLAPEAFMRRFGPRGRFMADALRRLGRDALLRNLRAWGVDTAAADGFHYFPVSQRAADVVDALRRELARGRVAVRLDTRVTALVTADGRIVGATAGGVDEPADAVVLAAGGAAWPALGGSEFGYELARAVGHTVVEPSPALVGLMTRETWPGACAGVTLPDVDVRLDLQRRRKQACRGILLFTHRGISGPVILDLSGDAVACLRAQPVVPLRLCLDATVTRGDWEARLAGWRRGRGARTVRNLLDEAFPQSLATALCVACGIPADLSAARLDAARRALLLDHLAAAPLTVVSAEGMHRAMVTRGGVDLREVDPARLESRRVRGLHIAGELLDLDGPCGGYNLQWAFSSGWLAGAAAAGGVTEVNA